MQPTTVAAALIASAAVLMGSAPPLHADVQDDIYLRELAARGTTHYPSDKLMGSGIAAQDIDAVVNVAARTYCP